MEQIFMSVLAGKVKMHQMTLIPLHMFLVVEKEDIMAVVMVEVQGQMHMERDLSIYVVAEVVAVPHMLPI